MYSLSWPNLWKLKTFGEILWSFHCENRFTFNEILLIIHVCFLLLPLGRVGELVISDSHYVSFLGYWPHFRWFVISWPIFFCFLIALVKLILILKILLTLNNAADPGVNLRHVKWFIILNVHRRCRCSSKIVNIIVGMLNGHRTLNLGTPVFSQGYPDQWRRHTFLSFLTLSVILVSCSTASFSS